jgi:quinol monooxygenase YgiN
VDSGRLPERVNLVGALRRRGDTDLSSVQGVGRFAQQTRLVAAPARIDDLVGKFLEAGRIQADNADCELMFVSKSVTEPNVVYLIEVWRSQEAWERAVGSEPTVAWAADMPPLVERPPETIRLDVIGGKGLSDS